MRLDYPGALLAGLPWLGALDLRESASCFFCSELVFAAYEQAGIPIVETPAPNAPGTVIAAYRYARSLALVGRLEADG